MYVNGTDNFLKSAKTNQLVNGCHEKFSWKVWVRQMRDPLYKKLNLDAELMKQFKGKYCKFVFFNFKKNLGEGGCIHYFSATFQNFPPIVFQSKFVFQVFQKRSFIMFLFRYKNGQTEPREQRKDKLLILHRHDGTEGIRKDARGL